MNLFETVEEHLLGDQRPSLYLNDAALLPEFAAYPFSMLLSLKGSPQPQKYHPEGDVWNHTMLVVDEAAMRKDESQQPRAFLWAALLHDLGKPGTTKIRNGKIISYGHDALGAKLAQDFLRHFGCDEPFIRHVAALVNWHMQILYFENSLPFFKEKELRETADMGEVGLLMLCDRLGRKGADRERESQRIDRFWEKVKGENSDLIAHDSQCERTNKR